MSVQTFIQFTQNQTAELYPAMKVTACAFSDEEIWIPIVEKYLEGSYVVFDFEWDCELVRKNRFPNISVIQLANQDEILVLHTEKSLELPDILIQLFTGDIQKVGKNKLDLKMFRNSFQHEITNFFDIEPALNNFHLPLGFEKLFRTLGIDTKSFKNKKISLGKWSDYPLPQKKVNYAAYDVWATNLVVHILKDLAKIKVPCVCGCELAIPAFFSHVLMSECINEYVQLYCNEFNDTCNPSFIPWELMGDVRISCELPHELGKVKVNSLSDALGYVVWNGLLIIENCIVRYTGAINPLRLPSVYVTHLDEKSMIFTRALSSAGVYDIMLMRSTFYSKKYRSSFPPQPNILTKDEALSLVPKKYHRAIVQGHPIQLKYNVITEEFFPTKEAKFSKQLLDLMNMDELFRYIEEFSEVFKLYAVQKSN
ncbi:hypothetical protein PCE1_003166 [Barthelona sp. PCE]